jgi:hypothetical protein
MSGPPAFEVEQPSRRARSDAPCMDGGMMPNRGHPAVVRSGSLQTDIILIARRRAFLEPFRPAEALRGLEFRAAACT